MLLLKTYPSKTVLMSRWFIRTYRRIFRTAVARPLAIIPADLLRGPRGPNGLRFRQGEAEVRSLAWLRFHPYPSPVPLHDFLADGEPDPGPRVFPPGVQPLEDLENPVGVPRIDSDAAVPHGD